MSSGPPPEASSAPSPGRPATNRRRRFAGRLWRPAGWSLRARLIVELLCLLALVCVLIGVVTELALRQFLVGQLDSQLQAAGGRSAAAPSQPPPEDGEGSAPNFLLAPGQAVGTLGAEVRHGHLERAGVLTSSGGQAPVPKAEQSVLMRLPVDGQPHTRRLGSLGDYRLLAAR